MSCLGWCGSWSNGGDRGISSSWLTVCCRLLVDHLLLLLANKLVHELPDLLAEGAEAHMLSCHLCSGSGVLSSILVVGDGVSVKAHVDDLVAIKDKGTVRNSSQQKYHHLLFQNTEPTLCKFRKLVWSKSSAKEREIDTVRRQQASPLYTPFFLLPQAYTIPQDASRSSPLIDAQIAVSIARPSQHESLVSPTPCSVPLPQLFATSTAKTTRCDATIDSSCETAFSSLEITPARLSKTLWLL